MRRYPRLLTRPPSIDSSLPRPRLVDLALSTPVAVIVAPEGHGATTAAAQAAAAADAPVAWSRLATGYASAADVIAMASSAFGDEVEPATRLIDQAEQLLTMTDVAPMVLVIDDLHLAADDSIDRLIAECVDLLPPSCHVIVTAHVRPAGLIGLVPAAALTVVGHDELAFTDDEAIDLFSRHGQPADRATRWNGALGGVAQAVATGATDPAADPTDHLGSLIDHDRRADPSFGAVLDAAAALPYVTVDLLHHLGVGLDAAQLESLAMGSPLFTTVDDAHRLSDTARDVALRSIETEAVTKIRSAGGRFLADRDPTAAIDVLIDAGDPDAAADVLADHLSTIGVERALSWLYRLPAELRRRFPPVLAAGQATVEVDAALAAARDRVEAADTERSRREALFALGSIEAHRGRLAAAAGAFEGALRATSDDPTAYARIAAELANTRWLVGDTLGAVAALHDADSSPAMRWLGAQLHGVGALDVPSVDHTDDPFDRAARALTEMIAGHERQASGAAAEAYTTASTAGGEPFLAAATVHAWCLLRSGHVDEADVIAGELERRLGPRHQLARVHAAIIRVRASASRSDRGAHERDQRRLRDLRSLGYAPIESLADRVLDGTDVDRSDAAIPVVVRVLGTHTAEVDGRTIRRSDWKSKKAFDVLTVLASYGPTGARREQVIEAVWPGRDPDKGRTLLRTALSEVRRVLEPGRPAGEPSSYLTTSEDTISLRGRLDIDGEQRFESLAAGLAIEIADAEWAAAWVPVLERDVLAAATAAAHDETADGEIRVRAWEHLIEAEPWKRAHYDSLGALLTERGDEAGAADVERRWFADD